MSFLSKKKVLVPLFVLALLLVFAGSIAADESEIDTYFMVRAGENLSLSITDFPGWEAKPDYEYSYHEVLVEDANPLFTPFVQNEEKDIPGWEIKSEKEGYAIYRFYSRRKDSPYIRESIYVLFNFNGADNEYRISDKEQTLPAYTYMGELLIPADYLLDNLPIEYAYDKKTGEYEIKKTKTVIKRTLTMHSGAQEMLHDGKKIYAPVPLIKLEGKDWLPLKYVADLLDHEIVEEKSTKRTKITIQHSPHPSGMTILSSRGVGSDRPDGAPLSGEIMIMQSTAYTHTGRRTFTGVYPAKGTIAVDPRVIPLGTKLWVEGYGYGVAQDTGGAIKGKIVDVFFDTRKECFAWGRRSVKVVILD